MRVSYEAVRLRRLCRLVRGRSYSASDYGSEGDGLPFVNLKCVGKGGTFTHRGLKWFKGAVEPEHFVTQGDLLLANTDLTPGGAVVGSPILLPDLPLGASISLDLSKLIVDESRVTREYLRYALLTVAARTFMRSAARGSTVLHLEIDRAKDCPVPLWSLAEQAAIVALLDIETARIDALVDKKHRLIGFLDERTASQREASVTRPGKPTGIPSLDSVPTDWEVLRNKVFLREVNDPSPDGSDEMLSVSHLTGVTPRSEKTVYMFEAESTIGYKRVRPGDLVINTMWAWMGAAGVSSYHGIVSPAYGVYRFHSDRVLPEFYEILVRAPGYIEEMTRFSRGVTSSRLRLYPDEFLRLLAPVPPIDLQRRLVAEFAAWTEVKIALVDRLERQIALLIEHRQALITAAVSGELAIPGVAA